MSGIFGLWNPDGRPVAREEIAVMADAISHRGPDGRQTVVDGPAALGYLHLETRIKPLPIVQPFVAPEAGLSIVLDGRIDNRDELTTLLESRGVTCQSGSDAELVLRTYQLCGTECPSQLLGDFAFAIWDSFNRRFFCARDQIGVKPFVYYYARNSLFAFSSEINGIIPLDRVPRRLNESRLADYLVNELDREDTEGTFYQGILRLPNGHFLVAERDSLRIVNYWKPPLKEGVRYRSIEEYGEAFRDLLTKATLDRIRDTKGIAYALSGGLDSSSVVAVARELSGGPSRANLPTFSLVDHKGVKALGMIRSVSDQGGIDSHLLWPEDVTAENFDLTGFIRKSNEPFDVDQGWFDWITYRNVKKQGLRVLLDGLDGDQMHPHPSCIGSMIRSGRWLPAIRDARHLSKDWNLPAWKIFVPYGLNPAFPAFTQALIKVKHALIKPASDPSISWIDQDLARRTRVEERCAARRQTIIRAARDPFLLHSLSFTVGLVSFALEYFGNNSSILGLELRHPLADRRIAEFLISLPMAQKAHVPASKNIMRSAVGNLLPEPLLCQRRLPHPGLAFHTQTLRCHREWLASKIKQALHSLRGYVNVDATVRLIHMYESKEDSESGYALWNIAVLAEWMDARDLRA